MSALQFQKVMAHLIRFPGDDWGKTLASVPGELSAEEKQCLEKMAQDPLVRKFGRKMRYLRLRDASTVMRLTRDFMEPDVLQHLFVEYFEPSRTGADLFWIGVNFLEFLLKDPQCIKALEQGAPYLKDVILYEATRARVERLVIRPQDSSLPDGSALAHQAFRIIDLNYDIPAIDRIKVKDPQSKAGAPVAKKMKLLIMRSLQSPYYRMFEIDGAIASFLNTQLVKPDDYLGDFPAAYSGMVGVGLCRKVETASVTEFPG